MEGRYILSVTVNIYSVLIYTAQIPLQNGKSNGKITDTLHNLNKYL